MGISLQQGPCWGPVYQSGVLSWGPKGGPKLENYPDDASVANRRALIVGMYGVWSGLQALQGMLSGCGEGGAGAGGVQGRAAGLFEVW